MSDVFGLFLDSRLALGCAVKTIKWYKFMIGLYRSWLVGAALPMIPLALSIFNNFYQAFASGMHQVRCARPYGGHYVLSLVH